MLTPALLLFGAWRDLAFLPLASHLPIMPVCNAGAAVVTSCTSCCTGSQPPDCQPAVALQLLTQAPEAWG